MPVPLPGEERWVEGVGAAGGAAYSAVEVNGRLLLRPPPLVGRPEGKTVNEFGGSTEITTTRTYTRGKKMVS